MICNYMYIHYIYLHIHVYTYKCGTRTCVHAFLVADLENEPHWMRPLCKTLAPYQSN